MPKAKTWFQISSIYENKPLRLSNEADGWAPDRLCIDLVSKATCQTAFNLISCCWYETNTDNMQDTELF